MRKNDLEEIWVMNLSDPPKKWEFRRKIFYLHNAKKILKSEKYSQYHPDLVH